MPFTKSLPKAKVYSDNYSRHGLATYSKMILMANQPDRICNNCGSCERIEIHHANGKWWDLRLKNLKWICIYCHKKHHQPMIAEKLSRTRKRLFKTGKLSIWNKGLTKYSDRRLEVVAIKVKDAKRRI